ncbi:MAG TPA: SgcJ/EcaC family oxidoreductase [Rubellimicrobium sp.]|nr:SgcJ/EcaC family oxidoreductase [Rubellimicrobium sp.]
MRGVRHMAGVAVLLVLGAASAQAQDTAELEAAQAVWEQAFATGDGTKAAEMAFTEDARLLPPGEPMVEGRKAIAQYWQAGFDAGVRDLQLGVVAVDMVGDNTMIETGTWAVTVPTEDGGTMQIGGKSLVVWKKDAEGAWRMAQDMWSSDE